MVRKTAFHDGRLTAFFARSLSFCSVENPLLQRVPDPVGTSGRLPDGRPRDGRDEGQGERAHVLAGGRGPPAPAEEGRVQDAAARTAARRQAPQVVEKPEGPEGRSAELAESPEDDHERPAVQVRVSGSDTCVGPRVVTTSRRLP